VKDRLKNPALLGAIAVALALAVLLIVLLGDSDDPEELTFNEFQEHIEAGEVAKVKLKDRSNLIEGELTDETKIEVQFPGEFGDELTTMIIEAEPPIEFEADPEKQSFWAGLFYSLLPVIVLVGVFLFVLNMMQGGGRGVMQFGKAKARKFSKDEPQVTFEDVAGADEAIEELREIKEFLQEPKKFQAMGAKIPKGVLLYGPPGTGKTLLARAVAGEAGAPFFSISGSDFVEMFVGVGASRVRDLFDQAKTAAPAIIFVDEIDAVGRHRGAGMGGGHDEREQTLNQLLVEMDGFDATTGVILIAATNRPDILDPALLRPGRFDRQIAVGVPDIAGREKILEVHAKGKPLSSDIELATVARRTAGFSGADLANLMNEGALLATRREKSKISMAELEEAMERVIAGPERKTNVMSDRERRIIAYHESGHAIVGQVLQHTDPIHKVTIIPRGRALGYTLSLPTQDKFLHSQSELCDLMAMALGGRAAEEIVFGDITSGASDDIKKVTSIARSMVTRRRGALQRRSGVAHRRRNQSLHRCRPSGGASDSHPPSRDARRARQRADGTRDARRRRAAGHLRREGQLGQHCVVATHARIRRFDHESHTGRRVPFDGSARSRPSNESAGESVTNDNPSPVDHPRIEKAVREILAAIGEDPDRDGLLETPARVARMYAEICAGLHERPEEHLKKTFDVDHDEMILVKDIPMYSLCEHHLLPFIGTAHVGYIPNNQGKVTGLSKLARLVDGYARRPQVQERLTSQIAQALEKELDPRGVIVIVDAEHLCMSMRGIRKPGSSTVTSSVRGLFRTNDASRAEAMRLIQGLG